MERVVATENVLIILLRTKQGNCTECHLTDTPASTSFETAVCKLTFLIPAGPIAGILVNKFGCRLVTIAGAVLASASLFVSIYAPNVQTLYVTIGLGAGQVTLVLPLANGGAVGKQGRRLEKLVSE